MIKVTPGSFTSFRMTKFSTPGSFAPLRMTKFVGLMLIMGLCSLSSANAMGNSATTSSTNPNPWDHVNTSDPAKDLEVWQEAKDIDPGIQEFYIAEHLRRLGRTQEAIDAYYRVLTEHTRTVIWAANGAFYWYPSKEALSRIRKLCALHPELQTTLEGAWLDIAISPDHKPEHDHVRLWRGKFKKSTSAPPNLAELEIVQKRGGDYVKAVQFSNGHWQLRVKDEPFVVKGVSYHPTAVGESAHAQNIRPWMNLDDNRNGLNDLMFESWVDRNKNNVQDEDEPIVGDATLLQNLGANTLRYYHTARNNGMYDPQEYNKELMRKLHAEYGIYFILGDFVGAYTVGSGAAWNAGTDYRSKTQRERMLKNVRLLVEDHKNEPYVLMWLLGNENQHHVSRTNASQYPKEFAEFLNEVAQMIHEIDPSRPVAVGNLASTGLREIALHAPQIDIYGANVYAGAYSMGSVVQEVKWLFDRPLLFTEWGNDVYFEGRGEDEAAQAAYIRSNWEDMQLNFAGNRGEGNIIGGLLFEWMDEWWKSSKGDSWGDPNDHNTQADFPFPFADGYAHEEWFGIVGQGNGSDSPKQRELRQAYFELQALWTQNSSK